MRRSGDVNFQLVIQSITPRRLMSVGLIFSEKLFGRMMDIYERDKKVVYYYQCPGLHA